MTSSNAPRPFDEQTKGELLAEHDATDDPQRISYILVLRLRDAAMGWWSTRRGTEEIVVKPMHPSIKKVGIFTGSTIMGDGRVALIADVAGILEHARLSFEPAAAPAGQRRLARGGRVLLFENGPHEQFALPLLQIRRVEMVDARRIERVGDLEYVTVDGVSLRLLRLDHVMKLSAPAATQNDEQQIALILPKFIKEPLAIVASRIVDTESLAIDLQAHSEHDEGILGSAIVRGRMTLFIDLHRLAQRLFSTAKDVPAPKKPAGKRAKRLLLVEDTPFFLEVVKPCHHGGSVVSRNGHERQGRAGADRVAGAVRPDCFRHRDAGHVGLGIRTRGPRPRRHDADARPHVP
ncbi:MAG: chemotaxis protein CheW [Isosphaeraceae bacterium]